MTFFTDTLTGRVRIKRQYAAVLDQADVAASMTPDRQPARSCRLLIELTGAAITSGLVNVAGSTNETFSFSVNGVQIGTKDFTSITGITISGISGGDIEIRAANRIGQPINQEVDVHESIPARVFPIKPGRVRMMPSGQVNPATHKMMVASTRNIQDNDLVYALSGIAGLTRAQVTFVETIFDFAGLTHHIEADVVPL